MNKSNHVYDTNKISLNQLNTTIMLLEINEHKLPEGKQMYENDAYPGPGLYAINDGISYHLVYNPDKSTGMAPHMMPVPIEIIKEHFAQMRVQSAKDDLSYQVLDRIDNMNKRLSKEADTLTATAQYYQPEQIDGNTLLKAIAIAQNPELAKDLLTKNYDNNE
jgi:hypothetical protein